MNDTNPIFHSLAVIEENIQEKLTVESLAHSIHLSKYHYQHLFREAVGDSVMRYVTRRRLSLAAADLAGTDASILEIALKYGYDSHEGFTRSFRAYMGITPKEYRKYYFSISPPKMQKERNAIMYSKTTDEIIRKLNSLIVQAKETAAYTRRNKNLGAEDAASYSQFWDAAAARADTMADELGAVLNRITHIPQCPDEISARFLIVKAVEDAVFRSNVTAFQTRLTVTRAKPEHRTAFEPLCNKYDDLARNARMSAGRIVEFFNELSALIFQDMRENATQKLQDAAAKGRAAAKGLSDDPALPYTYIAEEIRKIADELSSLALDEVSVSILENYLFRLDIIASAAELDMLRMPSHRPLFDGLPVFREQLAETISFFRNLPGDVILEASMSEDGAALERTASKKYSDAAFQCSIMLFYLKGEIQKLGQKLDEEQKAAFDSICGKMNTAIQLADRAEDETVPGKIVEILQEVYGKMEAEAGKLDIYGAPVQFIAKEIRHLASHIAAMGADIAEVVFEPHESSF